MRYRACIFEMMNDRKYIIKRCMPENGKYLTGDFVMLSMIKHRVINFFRKLRYSRMKNIMYADAEKEKLLFISHTSTNGGAVVLLRHIVCEVKKRGYDTVIISKNYGNALEKFYQISETYVCSKEEEFIAKIDELSQRGFRDCFVNSVVSGDFVPALKSKKFRVVSLIHELPWAIHVLNAEGKARCVSESSDVVVFPSTFVQKKFEEIAPVKSEVRICTQGLYLFNENTSQKEDARRHIEEYLGKELNKSIVLSVATSSYRKGFDLFVEMAKRDPEKEYIWIGFEKNFFSLKKIIGKKSKNLDLVGYIKDAKLLDYFYSSADIYVLPSREEPFGTVVIEAFNHGLPVIAFNGCGGYIDIVKDWETGLLIDEISSNSMLEGISLLLSKKKEKKIIGENCKTVASGMTFSVYVDKLLECMQA